MISEVELKEIATKVGQETADKIKSEFVQVEKTMNEKIELVTKGLMTEADFNLFKKDQLEPLNATLKEIEKASVEQGVKMQSLLEKSAPNTKSLENFLEEKAEEIKGLRSQAGGKAYMEFTGAELKAAGVYSIAGAIPTASPYAPGIGGDLEIFDIARNPNFITSRVDLGRTNQARLAWANEIPFYNETNGGGVAGLVLEGATKPQTQHRFSIETSNAKKVAGWVELTEEFDQDLPQFATQVRRMLQDDVIRAYDDQVQLDVIAASRPFEITQLNATVPFANYFDALLAMMGQVGFNNFIPNTAAYNWLTNVIMKGDKNTNGTYLLPSFMEELDRMTVYANKVLTKFGLVGDLKQYKVDIYKDFVLKVGWINDEFINNKFAILGEVRFHSYISDARKKALVYSSLDTVDGLINQPAA